MRILITGTTGQIGSALLSPLASLGTVLPVVRRDLDLGLGASIEPTLDRLNPDLIINPAAYTAVDRAEDEPELAHAINAVAPGVIARWAAVRKVPFIHFSTDYVFDGSRDSPWREQDPTRPLSVYGVSKLEGEKRIRSTNGPHLILRTSWVYAARGQNFLRTIARLAAERDELRIVNDQVGAPTSARSIAEAITHLLAVGQPDLARYFAMAGGLVHLAAAGETSWHGFASEVVKGLRARGITLKASAILPIATKDYPTKAMRPRNSRLALEHLAHSFGIIMPDWKEGLKRELDELARQKLDGAS
jgi:dTDP-4-dehydrorhamnose reductase